MGSRTVLQQRGALGPVVVHFSQQPGREGGNSEFCSCVLRVRKKQGLEPQDRPGVKEGERDQNKL